MSERLTKAEVAALLVAVNASLASPVLDGYDDDEDDERALRRAMLSAQTKLRSRLLSTPGTRHMEAGHRVVHAGGDDPWSEVWEETAGPGQKPTDAVSDERVHPWEDRHDLLGDVRGLQGPAL